MKQRLLSLLATAGLVAGLMVVTPAAVVLAADVTISVPTTFAAADASDGTTDGTFNVSGNLTIASTGSITCNDPASPGAASACPIKIVVTGNMVMEAGSKITADQTVGGGNAGDITITVGGDMTMCGPNGGQPGCASPGPAALGALISATRNDTNAPTVVNTVAITVGNTGDPLTATPPTGTFYMEGGSTAYGAETGAKIITDSRAGKSGNINITPGKTFFAEPGAVIQSGFGDGTSTQIGGKIFVISDCGLTAEGRITSKGPDPGADLIHLESCDVTIRGLVESTGKGHTIDAANSCDNVVDGYAGEVFRAGKPAFTTGCIEVWAKLITIDSFTDGWAGELNADIGDGGHGGTSWIDIFALSRLTVTDGAGNARTSSNGGGTYLSTYAVHANAIDGSDDSPGVVTALVKSGPLTASGNAFEASSTLTAATGHVDPGFVGNGSTGGTIRLEASDTVTLANAGINASGDFAGGPPCPSGSGDCGNGGHIIVHAWGTGSDINWTTGSGDVRPNNDDSLPGDQETVGGTIIVAACDLFDVTGTNFHGETAATSSGGANCDVTQPTFPVYNTKADGTGMPIQVFGNEAIWTLCGQSTISGTKWNDKDGNGVRDPGDDGIDGWVIHLFGTTLASHQTFATTGGGNYTFTVSAGVYTICEQLQPGWTETSPTGPASATIADCAAAVDPAGDNPTPGPWGYTVDLTGTCCAGTTVEHKDFGNHLTEHHKTGMKFEDLNGNGQKEGNEPGIPGWPITLTFPDASTSTVNTDANGEYSFTLDGPGTYMVCEGVSPLPGIWVQSFPNANFPNPVPNGGPPTETVISTCPVPNVWGYQFTVSATTGDFTDNDFGNYEKASKSGTKFNDVAGDGTPLFEGTLDGWTIKLFGTDGLGNPVSLTTVTGPVPPGGYSFPNLDPGTYTVCEVLFDATWTQTYPNVTATDGTACETAGYAAGGYTFTLVSGQDEINNDFANHTTVTCPEDPGRAAALTRVVVSESNFNGSGSGVAGDPKQYKKVQEAYNDALASGHSETIGLFANTTENLVLGGSKNLTITQCTVARVTGVAGVASPVWDITSTGKLTIVGPDSVGGSIGWRVAGNGGHTLKSIRANGATVDGVLIVSNGNSLGWNAISGNGDGTATAAGIRVVGNTNTLKGGTVASNNGDGVQLVGASNSLSGSKIQSNTRNGVIVTGQLNTVSDNKNTIGNGADGFNFAAFPATKGTKVKGNEASNNTGNEFTIGANNVNQGGNKFNGVAFTFTLAAVNKN